MKRRLKTGLSIPVISFSFRSNKMYGTSDHGKSNPDSKLEFSFFAEIAQNAGNKIFKRNAPPKYFSPVPGLSDLGSSFSFLLKVQERAIGIGEAARLREVRKLYIA